MNAEPIAAAIFDDTVVLVLETGPPQLLQQPLGILFARNRQVAERNLHIGCLRACQPTARREAVSHEACTLH